MEVLICPVQIIDCYNYGDFAQMIEKAQIYDKKLQDNHPLMEPTITSDHH